jgi:hypothetical protein
VSLRLKEIVQWMIELSQTKIKVDISSKIFEKKSTFIFVCESLYKNYVHLTRGVDKQKIKKFNF